jgi:hypothetical protein
MLKQVVRIITTVLYKYTLCGQNTELLDVKAGGTYSYHWTLKC